MNLNVYVVRTTDGVNLKDSAPCIDCFMKMKQLGIKNIIYSSETGIIKKRVEHYVPKTISLGRLYMLHDCKKKITRDQLMVFREKQLDIYFKDVLQKSKTN